MALTKSLKEIISEDRTGLLSTHPTWERVCLREVASILNGFPFESRFFHTSEGMPLIRIRDVLSGAADTFYNGEYEQQFLVHSGDLLVGMDGDFNSARWRSTPGLLNQRVCKITNNEAFYSERLLELALPGYLAAINAATSSVTVKHLSSKSIEEIELPLPPRAEQERIVEKLEELLSDLDAGVAELKAAQKKLAQYRQSLLKAAVEGALTAQWRQSPAARNVESGADLLQRILRERRALWEARQLARFKEQGKAPPKGWQAKYPEPVAPDTTDLPELPKGWVWASIDQLSPDDLANGRSVPTAASGARVLRLTAIQSGRVDLGECKVGDWTSEEAKPFAVAKGDLLIVRGNGSLTLVGRAGLVAEVSEQVAYPDTMIRLRVVESVVRPAWIGLLWDASITRKHLEGRARTSAGIYKISQPDIVSVAIPIPPLKEQDQMLSMLDRIDEEMRAVQGMIEFGTKQSTAQRKNILQAAFSGQLVPQDSNDEPASALLERIRTERAQRAATTPSRRKIKKTA